MQAIAEPIPMKRELKRSHSSARSPSPENIAEPIPMKRELKHKERYTIIIVDTDCRAYPDEKGIETDPGRSRRSGSGS